MKDPNRIPALNEPSLPADDAFLKARSLSVILPAYNEAPNLVAAVERAMTVLPQLAEDYEVVVVDDGSTDQTAALTQDLVARFAPHVRVLRHPQNRGYGAALRTGFLAARHDLVFYTDADNQFDIAELYWFLPVMDEYDMAVGFRVYRYDTVLRSIASWCYNRLVGVIFRVQVRDVDCAYKLMRRELIDKIDIECDDFFVDTELLARARKWNFRIAEKGVRHYPRLAGETTVRPSDIPRTLRVVARMWRQIYYPTKDQRAATARRRDEAGAVEVLPEPVDAA